MSTLELCLVLGASSFSFGVVVGYGVPKLYALAVARAVERERVVAGLAGTGGAIPAWEQTARDLEKAAVEQAKRGMSSTSETLLDQAANVRARGKAGG